MFKNILAFVISSVAIFGADLGVLFNSTNNNTVSPDNLVIATFVINTNLELKYITPARALSIDSNSNVVSSTLTDTQQGYLAALTGGTNLINLGSAKLVSGQGNPTNGVMSTNRTLYVNTSSAVVNDTLWINLDTNWFRVASTNGGSINESQLNFSDVTTANVTTNLHGLIPKLPGNAGKYLNGLGSWVIPPFLNVDSVSDNEIPRYQLSTDTLLPSGLFFNSIGDITANTIIRSPAASITVGTFNDIRVNSFADVITGNVTLSAHGLVPKADGNSGHFLNGLGLWSTPAGGGAGSIASTGSPLDTYMTRWTGTNTITGTPEFTYDHQVLFVPKINATNYVVPDSSATSQLTSGRYTPTRTPINNCTTAGTISLDQHFVRVGNQVTVSGLVYMARTSSGSLDFSITLPISTENVNPSTLNGFGDVFDGSDLLTIGQVVIYADANYLNQAVFKSIGASTFGTLRAFRYSFTYNTN